MSRAAEILGVNDASEDEEDIHFNSEEEESRGNHFVSAAGAPSSGDEEEKELNEEEAVEERKKLAQEESRRRLKEIKKSGVVYLSSLPPYMKPVKVRQILERFGKVGRIYLSPEDSKVYQRRVKNGGNRKRKYDEGWAEFVNKKHAKLAVDALNGNTLGGKKGSFYYDDIMCLKYLPKFKWHDLTEQIALESQERQEKMKAEIAQATRENRVFIDNVEQKQRIDRQKRKAAEAGEDMKSRELEYSAKVQKHSFTQRPTKQSKKTASGSELSNVLSKVF